MLIQICINPRQRQSHLFIDALVSVRMGTIKDSPMLVKILLKDVLMHAKQSDQIPVSIQIPMPVVELIVCTPVHIATVQSLHALVTNVLANVRMDRTKVSRMQRKIQLLHAEMRVKLFRGILAIVPTHTHAARTTACIQIHILLDSLD